MAVCPAEVTVNYNWANSDPPVSAGRSGLRLPFFTLRTL